MINSKPGAFVNASAFMPSPRLREDSTEELSFVVASPKMAQVRTQSDQVAAIDVPVLLLGESGVGKDVIARYIHSRSPRSHRTFLKVNCAALPGDLLESELFGYEAGAFTGASRSKPGKFELCNGGTIFLDEIGELPVHLQAKLLQVLEDRQFARLGGRSLISVDVRILAATNINIEKALASKQFREDLFYRLDTFTLRIPPLRERREEIPKLLYHFMRFYAGKLGLPAKPVTDELVEICMNHSWPGNVRELANLVRRILIFEGSELRLHDLLGKNGNGHSIAHIACNSDTNDQAMDQPVDLKSMVHELKAKAEIETIQRALRAANGNRAEAARLLMISTKALLNKTRRYGIVVEGAEGEVWEEQEQNESARSEG